MSNWTAESEAAFGAYVDALIGVIGHADRAESLKDYCLECKSADRWRPSRRRRACLPSISLWLHFVGGAVVGRGLPGAGSPPGPSIDRVAWTDPSVDRRRHGLSQEGQALGGRSAPVLRPVEQAGQLIGVSLSIANDAALLPIAYQLYLQHSGAEDPEQYKKAKIPTEITFQIKPQIALEQIKTAKAGDGVAINLPWSMIVQRTSAMFRVPCS